MNEFSSLTIALENWFDRPLQELPGMLQKRIGEQLLPPWDGMSATQRREAALQWDYQHDPATETGRNFWDAFHAKQEELHSSLETWKSMIVSTAEELETQQTRIESLRAVLHDMDTAEKLANYRYVPHKIPVLLNVSFIPYLKAIKLLEKKLNATAEELAAWVWLGPDAGGLRAWTNANEMNPPPVFYFMNFGMAGDYVSDLMPTWYAEEDIAAFQPKERYITGKALMERWMESLGEHLDMFVQAKIQESRLNDLHPHVGMTQWSEPKSSATKESALFPLSEVIAIEEEDGIEISGKNCKEDKPLFTNERNTLLTIIAALCDYSDIKYQERGVAGQIAKMTEEIGAPITDDTIRKALAKIPDAMESRKK